MNDEIKEQMKEYREKVDIKLIIRQRIFFVIISVLLVTNIINVAKGKMEAVLAIGGLILAALTGFALSRVFKIFWHTEKAKVLFRIDALGIILFIVYIGIELSRKWVFQYWLSGEVLSAFSLVILTGLLLGRFLGTFITIRRVLKENKDIDKLS